MEQHTTQKEILLMTGTSFSARNHADKTDAERKTSMSDREQLEEACWNGLLQDMLPEVFEQTEKKLYLWQIREADAFIELELADAPVIKYDQFSLDPYSFLATTPVN
ncbi:MAG TPA: hypothetical protein VMI35_13250 [Puia sp.]|nr:hypothetical protein [Puia sp.]